MASPAVSTPSTAGSPPAISLASGPQALAMKQTETSNMAAGCLASPLATPTVMTSKEWVIPPRPKPGRKPATDTPPTKRKAQNRAAQRAFRERRAARVGELEEHLEEVREDFERRETELKTKVSRLETELGRFNSELQSWKFRCNTLDRIVDYEKREKEAALAELSYLRNGAHATNTDAVPLPPRRPRQTEQKAPEVRQPSQDTAPLAAEETSIGCGNCTSTSRCACVEEAVAMASSGCGRCTADTRCQCLEETMKITVVDLHMSTELKRSHSPATDDSVEKRQRQSDPSTSHETDFTTQYSTKLVPQQQAHLPQDPAVQTVRPPAEPCGFCEEGTYCVCAEAAAAANAALEQDYSNHLPPLLNEATPPPSDNDAEGSKELKLPSFQTLQIQRPVAGTAPANSCVNGPGTCQQCQADPKSGLFCRSLAAMRLASTSNPAVAIPDGCCGAGGKDGGCCKSLPAPAPSQPPPSLSCADTYKTLSTHKNFDQASDELSTWLGKLHAKPPVHAGRAPIEVEAASVMGVLKLFDRRFGRG